MPRRNLILVLHIMDIRAMPISVASTILTKDVFRAVRQRCADNDYIMSTRIIDEGVLLEEEGWRLHHRNRRTINFVDIYALYTFIVMIQYKQKPPIIHIYTFTAFSRLVLSAQVYSTATTQQMLPSQLL